VDAINRIKLVVLKELDYKVSVAELDNGFASHKSAETTRIVELVQPF